MNADGERESGCLKRVGLGLGIQGMMCFQEMELQRYQHWTSSAPMKRETSVATRP